MVKSKLVGWDDGKIYFYDEAGKEYCVNDHEELFGMIMKLCMEHFRKMDIAGKDDRRS